MEHKYKYNAFISYRHISPDKDIADRLQKKLENYKPPKAFGGEGKSGSWRIFRDETELPTSSNLSEDIKKALEESEFLIVICSENTKKSRWCMEEIDYFKKLHNGNNANIITLVADGNPQDVFPPSLCNELIAVTDENGNTTYQNHVIEPLAANVAGKNLRESMKKLNTEFLRIAAPILGCGYDNLYNREHKKKIRRIFTFGGIALAVLFLFVVYNSAMLWQISNQKVALAAANADLQLKTEELDASNAVLKQTNKELEQKTEEAEANLTEANRQKEIAETNLSEAQRQKSAAEKNLQEANRQKKIAEENLKEANRQKAIAEENLKEANRQKIIAEENAEEANRQRAIAEENAAEANRQKKNAEDNAAEANKQKTIAENNEKEAKEANKNLKIKNAEILIGQAQDYMTKGEEHLALQKAIDALSGDGEAIATDSVAEKILADATGVYSNADKMICNTINLSSPVKFMEFSEDGTRVLAGDTNGITYVIDYDKNKVIKTYTPIETFGQTSNYVSDICVDKNTGYVLCHDQVISINLEDGSLNWHYNKGYSDFIRLDELVTNPDSDIIAAHGGYSMTVLNKADGSVIYETEHDYAYYSTLSDCAFMDKEGTLYTVSTDEKCITADNFSGNAKKVAIDAEKIKYILSIGEADDCIVINMLLTETYADPNVARVVCYNKKDMSVKWETEYTSDYVSTYGIGKIFGFNHKVADADDNYIPVSGIAVVVKSGIYLFEKETGELYFYSEVDPDEDIVYCAPNTKTMSVKIGTTKMFGNQVFLYPGGGSLSATDQLIFINENYYFDEERQFVSYAENNRFALASENSSEINLYHYNAAPNHTVLDTLPHYSNTQFADNGNGLLAVNYSNQDENNVAVYDVNENKLVLDTEIGFRADVIRFVGEDKILVLNNDGKAKVIYTDGSVGKEADLKSLIRSAAELSENTYISSSMPYVKTFKESALYCISNGIFKIDLSGGEISVQKILSYKNLRDFHVDSSIVSFVSEEYSDRSELVAYFREGDKELGFVSENGQPLRLPLDSVYSVTNSEKGEKVAFINKEGYIGIQKYGSDNLSKINIPRGEVAPVKITFTPDGKYLIAICSDGSIIKYSAESPEEIQRYKSDIKIDDYSVIEFVDDKTFLVMEYKSSPEIKLFDCEFMQLKAEISDFRYFMMADKKIIYSSYRDNGYVYGYYKYRTGKELIEYAKTFLQ